MNKKVAVLMLSMAALTSAFARDVVEKSVGAENSWQEDISLEHKSSGKYNIVVTATDIAGNEAVAGPFNMYIDPESDLPVIGITNPAYDMQVPGNLNIVGTCVDDDGTDHVNLILDGDKDNVVTATGAEFWSYYLDTTQLTEGPHTIEVYGTDINGLEGHTVKTVWNLNRKNPDTVVSNPGMGTLVSGKINLTGYVKDGNGIKSLEYSLDGGQHYKELKLKEQKLSTPDDDGATSHYLYTVPVETTKFADGPAICWFKGIDNAGSVGYYAFLYFIDNTSPEITIVTPEESEAQNGVFTIAGYAKDTNGMKSLSWQWGNEKGDFELIAGNPYFCKEINSIGLTKPQTFTVSGTDTMGNVVTVSRTIAFNQEADKPVVEIKYPANGLEVSGEDGSFYLRGIATDDDGLTQVVYKLDNGEEQTLEAKGVFYADIPGNLSYGSHTIRVYGIDKYGVKGNAATSTFTATGVAPEFATATVKSGKNSVEFTSGLQINPESDSTFDLPVTSSIGLASVKYEITWGTNGVISGQVPVTGAEKKANVTFPVSGEDFPWGVSKLTVKAVDTFNRESVYTALLNVMNLTKANVNNAGVYFTDSTLSDDGTVLLKDGNTVSGYFAGGKAASVQLVPAQKNVTASLDGNTITLTASGSSDLFTVRVTNAAGGSFDSRQIRFVAQANPPVLTIDDNSIESGTPVDFSINQSFTVKGKVDSGASVKYRKLVAKADVVDGVVKGSSVIPPVSYDEATPVTLDRNGNFSQTFNASDFEDGVTVVEFIAANASGVYVSKAVIVNNVPAKRVALDGEVIPPSAEPAVYWMQGNDWYGVCVYQGTLNENIFKFVDLSTARPGTVDFSVTPADASGKSKKPYSASVQISKKGVISGHIASVDGNSYKSGMNVVLNRGVTAEEKHTVTVMAESSASLVAAEWTIDGDQVPGGDVKQSGKLAVTPVSEGSTQYQFEIPLVNLPARITSVSLRLVDSTGSEATVKGTINVVRRHDVIDDEEKFYFAAAGKTVYDEKNSRYVLEDGSVLEAFGNFNAPFTPAFARAVDGLSVKAEGHIITVSADKDGTYSGIQLKTNDGNGSSYTSSAVNLIADTAKPVIQLSGPANMSWVKKEITLEGTVSDGSGIASLQYAIFDEKPAYTVTVPGEVKEDGTQAPSVTETRKDEPEWKAITPGKGGAFSARIDVSGYEEGYIPVDLKAVDGTGKVSYYRIAVQKDTVAPEVKVILPDEGAKVNGENLILFTVKDAGSVETVTYNSSDKKIAETYKFGEQYELESTADTLTSSAPNALVGTEAMPIDNGMSFAFTDGAGNRTTVNNWAFTVDAESDKPVAEVHMPEENAVITTDFTVSGIVYDDDGACRVWFKIDNGEYMLISEEYSSSYKINIPLSAMTDNGHTVTVQAEDMHGTKGPEFKRNFRISLEEPKGSVDKPSFDETVKGYVTLSGKASDKNGINKVQISLDNGASYNDADGTENWSYTFDSRVIHDGTHVVFLKIWDGYDITGLYSSLVNIDNTAPELNLELPLDDSTIRGTAFFSGQTTDNIGLKTLSITVRSLDSKVKVPDSLAHIDLTPDEIIAEKIDLSGLPNGFYNLELEGTDAANNITRVSRNIQLNKDVPATRVGILYPLNGQHVQSVFTIYGDAHSEEKISKVDLYIDGVLVPGLYDTEITDSGYYKFEIKNTMKQRSKTIKDEDGNETEIEAEEYVLEEGTHSYKVVATTESGNTVTSNEQTFIYSKFGPWITLGKLTYGDFATNRPLLKGSAGYVLSEEEAAALKDKNTPSEILNAIKAKTVQQISISFDNGKTFTPVAKEGKTNWQYRIEDADLAEGTHFMLLKAQMENGECAVTRLIIQIDHTKPSIQLLTPGEGGRYNQSLAFEGLTSDDVALKDVHISLRKGDKASYEVPGFIQGLYFDASVWGATLYNVGVGLTAFNNAVKIQGNFGQMTETLWNKVVIPLTGTDPGSTYRFGGNAIGGKIIAQLMYLPFSSFLGHDFDWLSMSMSVGANFTWFSESGAIDQTTGESVAQILSSVMAQIEFPRITFSNQKVFKTWALYYEPQLWFIPSDIASDEAKRYVFTYSFGIHSNVF